MQDKIHKLVERSKKNLVSRWNAVDTALHISLPSDAMPYVQEFPKNRAPRNLEFITLDIPDLKRIDIKVENVGPTYVVVGFRVVSGVNIILETESVDEAIVAASITSPPA